MSISVFPAPSAVSGPNAKTFTVATAYESYKISDTFLAGGYTITTSPSTSQVEAVFINESEVIATLTTISGTVSGSLSSDATQVYLKTTGSGTNTVVTIENTASNAPGAALSGTLDTITNTSTYNETGLLYVMTVGGGAGGGRPNTTQVGQGRGGGGGGSGGVDIALLYTNTSTAITIGNGGSGGKSTATPGSSGGATSFGNLVSVNGGGGGQHNGDGGSAGSLGGGGGGSGAGFNGGSVGSPSNRIYNSITSGTTGGGGGGGRNGPYSTGYNGGGSGIGTGGKGGNSLSAGASGTGYGSGGGGGGAYQSNNYDGGDGTAGIVYVLRGF